MTSALLLTRTIFVVLSVLFTTVCWAALYSNSILTGIALGIFFAGALIGIDLILKNKSLRLFNLTALGLFFGFLMGKALTLVLDTALNLTAISSSLPQTTALLKLALFLFSLYFGTILTIKAADELHLAIPFIRLTSPELKKKDLFIDSSILTDARVIDLASSGLIDNHLIVARFIIKDLLIQAENTDEACKAKARKGLETLKKLEEIPHLELRYMETDFSEIKEQIEKLVKLARENSAHILTADLSKVQISNIEGIKIINLHTLANALKPLMQTGEILKIKIQRYGKEPKQGVGYLEDGTMVVVNGGGDFIGQTIDVQVLSVKHTASGRIIFCNAQEEALQELYQSQGETYE